ncbi:tubulin-tyrosine ligase/Tubulin polyglutamylase, partial [Tribonema minus]
NVHWVDVAAIGERLRELAPWQRVNHFPGMAGVARKARMAQALDRMRRAFPLDYRFYPRTWVLPSEACALRSEFDAAGRSARTLIVKPDAGCQGKGIYLTQELDDRLLSMDSQVVQLYVRRPLLIDGYKFDLRVYVLVTSIRPLRVYAFRDGLARLCTSAYVRPAAANMGDRCMHLTNYAINRRSDNFVANADAERDDTGSKRSLRWLLEWVGQTHGEARARRMWRRMGQCAVKTLVPVLPQLHREYRATFGADGSRCIEVLGFDFMVDEALKPWLIEVNHLPSFATDSPLDASIKVRRAEQTPRCVASTAPGRTTRCPLPQCRTCAKMRCIDETQALTRMGTEVSV